MANARLLPRTTVATDVVTYTIKVNGAELPNTLRVLGMSISKEVNRIPTGNLVFIDGSPAGQDFPLSNNTHFVPGNELEIHLGYRSEETLLFKGIIIKQQLSVRSNAAHLEVDCRDIAYRMTLRRKGKYFEQVKDSEVAAQILDEYDFSHDITETSYQHIALVQYDATDWDFLLMRMDFNGLLTIANGGSFVIQAPDFNQETALQLFYGATVLEFDAALDVRDQFTQVITRTWDYANQEIVEIQAAEPNITANGNLPGTDIADANGDTPNVHRHGGQILSGELQSWADARLLKDRLSRTRGRVQIRGYENIAPGQLLELGGFGERFNGLVYVAGVRHELYEGIWLTDIEFGLSPEWFAQSVKVQTPPAAGMLAAVSGLQVGVVTQIENDPAGEHRVKVRLPILDSTADGVWARIATLDAGNNRGTFFRPEVGDEMVLGFINDDPRDAILLGMLHSQNLGAPFQASSQNLEKGYVSREGLKVVFQEQDKSITLETPAGNKLLISDANNGKIVLEDQHGNSITMDNAGIKIKSASSINLEADTAIQNNAGSSWEVNARQQAKLTANGVTEIKGNPVNIN